jgi:LAO/AO transport system kinase
MSKFRNLESIDNYAALNTTRLTSDQYIHGILSGDRIILGKAITLVESSLASDQNLASEVLDKILHKTGKSLRIGITGVPGVGKSTFIEAFGTYLTDQGKKIAILTVDPSSQLTRGSILGDKTRMEDLSKNPLAFIRPSASGNMLGGVTGKTREAMLLCEAAGFEVILIETVGVGQSEVAVRNMVDFFLLLMLAGAGDELQGIKKGIMEMADALVITKADGDNLNHAKEAQSEYSHALHLLPSKASHWEPKVLTSSAVEKTGMDEVWKMILKYEHKTKSSGFFELNRQRQNISWFEEYFQTLLSIDFTRYKSVIDTSGKLKSQVGNAIVSPLHAAQKLLDAYHQAIKNKE